MKMQSGRCSQGLGPALVSVISKRAYAEFIACWEMLIHATQHNNCTVRSTGPAGMVICAKLTVKTRIECTWA